MSAEAPRASWSLPYSSPLPAGTRGRIAARLLRVAAYAAAVAAVVVPMVIFQVGTVRRLREAAAFDEAHPDWTPAKRRSEGLVRPGATKGAVGRWRRAVRQFWDGRNIYEMVPADYSAVATQPVSSVDCPADYGLVFMHPNMPFTVMLLTPLAYAPVQAAGLSFNLLKALVLAAAVLMAARLAGHRRRRIVDWIVALGLLWTILPVVGDVRHGNTNVFVLGAVVLHLWLFRRGFSAAAGLPLALAVCLKMTPALFLLYWLYQRNWKLLAGAVIGLCLFGVIVPAAAVGPARYATLTRTWCDNMIRPGLVEGGWYPEHINQSLSGVAGRYFLAGRNGDIYWGPDDDPHYQTTRHGWITLAALPEGAVRWIVRAGRLAIVALMLWSIGWRRLACDDGRRALHYAMVLLAMMLLNQRTWNHHAAVLLPAGVAIWQAIGYGRFGRGLRATALGLVVAGGLASWLLRSDLIEALARAAGQTQAAAETCADTVKAYGPMFYYFLLLFVAAAILAAALKRAREPYAETRQKLGVGHESQAMGPGRGGA